MNKILKGFKVELNPNNRQATLFKMNCGASRWAFNWAKLDHKSGKINNSLTLADRTIIHDDGTTTDRDMNAAINLKNYYLINLHTASSAEIKVYGERSPTNGVSQSYSPSVKQKSNRKSK